jgi:hypothetical protein
MQQTTGSRLVGACIEMKGRGHIRACPGPTAAEAVRKASGGWHYLGLDSVLAMTHQLHVHQRLDCQEVYTTGTSPVLLPYYAWQTYHPSLMLVLLAGGVAT